MKFKRLKIVEQIIIISLIGVLVPSVISWFVINNVSQHSLRQELGNSAQMFAKIIENNIFSVINITYLFMIFNFLIYFVKKNPDN